MRPYSDVDPKRTLNSLLPYRETGQWIHAPLVERARELDVDLVDHAPRLMEWIGDGDPCALYLACNNHFNAAGNALLASLVARAIEERGLEP